MSGDAPIGIGIVMLGVREMPRSLAFYRDVLGLPVSFASDEFAFLKAGAVTLGLRVAADLAAPGDERRTELVFEVEDIDASHERLGGRGIAFRIAPRIVTGDQLAADFRDPDGHVLSILGPRKAGAR
ncbi:MAG: VOC family protein [Acidobacteriota bacterium]